MIFRFPVTKERGNGFVSGGNEPVFCSPAYENFSKLLWHFSVWKSYTHAEHFQAMSIQIRIPIFIKFTFEPQSNRSASKTTIQWKTSFGPWKNTLWILAWMTPDLGISWTISIYIYIHKSAVARIIFWFRLDTQIFLLYCMICNVWVNRMLYEIDPGIFEGMSLLLQMLFTSRSLMSFIKHISDTFVYLVSVQTRQ